jgi:hypothetical protein
MYLSEFVYKYIQVIFVDVQDLSDSGAGPTRRLPDRSQLGHLQQGRGDCADHEQVNPGIIQKFLVFCINSNIHYTFSTMFNLLPSLLYGVGGCRY